MIIFILYRHISDPKGVTLTKSPFHARQANLEEGKTHGKNRVYIPMNRHNLEPNPWTAFSGCSINRTRLGDWSIGGRIWSVGGMSLCGPYCVNYWDYLATSPTKHGRPKIIPKLSPSSNSLKNQKPYFNHEFFEWYLVLGYFTKENQPRTQRNYLF